MRLGQARRGGQWGCCERMRANCQRFVCWRQGWGREVPKSELEARLQVEAGVVGKRRAVHSVRPGEETKVDVDRDREEKRRRAGRPQGAREPGWQARPDCHWARSG